MFSMLPTPAHTHLQSHHYTPTISSPLSSSPLRASPSPLSPRDSNLPSARNFMMSPTPTPLSKQNKTPSSSRSSRESAFSKRASKPNPLLNKGDEEGRETRRKLFLKKVKEGSEDKRWKARGGEEEMMRTIWVMEERRRVARQRELLMGEGELEESYLSLDDVMVEEVEGEEERELDAILAGLDEGREQQMPPGAEMGSLLWEGMNAAPARQEAVDTPYGSDDEEYDHIFMDVIQEESRQATQQQPEQTRGDADQDMMDMS